MKHQHWLGRLWQDILPDLKQAGINYTSQIYTISKNRFNLSDNLRVVGINYKEDSFIEFLLMYEQKPVL